MLLLCESFKKNMKNKTEIITKFKYHVLKCTTESLEAKDIGQEWEVFSQYSVKSRIMSHGQEK